MHDCQKFREDWIAGAAAGTEDAIDCEECLCFCEEADVILLATAAAAPSIPEFSDKYWNGFEGRLRETLIRENAARSSQAYWRWSALAAAAAIALVVTWGTMRPARPNPPQVEFVNDHIQGLDPMVVAFLERSELFLRNYTKIEPSHGEDLADSQVLAKESLMEIGEQRELAGSFAPVRMTLDEYENVLREIKNMGSSEELVDLQKRILANGLIANLKAYQPQVMLVSQR
jgi:hypothetical protein